MQKLTPIFQKNWPLLCKKILLFWKKMHLILKKFPLILKKLPLIFKWPFILKNFPLFYKKKSPDFVKISTDFSNFPQIRSWMGGAPTLPTPWLRHWVKGLQQDAFYTHKLMWGYPSGVPIAFLPWWCGEHFLPKIDGRFWKLMNGKCFRTIFLKKM